MKRETHYHTSGHAGFNTKNIKKVLIYEYQVKGEDTWTISKWPYGDVEAYPFEAFESKIKDLLGEYTITRQREVNI